MKATKNHRVLPGVEMYRTFVSLHFWASKDHAPKADTTMLGTDGAIQFEGMEPWEYSMAWRESYAFQRRKPSAFRCETNVLN